MNRRDWLIVPTIVFGILLWFVIELIPDADPPVSPSVAATVHGRDSGGEQGVISDSSDFLKGAGEIRKNRLILVVTVVLLINKFIAKWGSVYRGKDEEERKKYEGCIKHFIIAYEKEIKSISFTICDKHDDGDYDGYDAGRTITLNLNSDYVNLQKKEQKNDCVIISGQNNISKILQIEQKRRASRTDVETSTPTRQILLGGPGTGKSVYLKKKAWDLLANVKEEDIFNDSFTLPIYVECKEFESFVRRRNGERENIFAFVAFAWCEQYIRQKTTREKKVFATYIKKCDYSGGYHSEGYSQAR